MPEFEYLSTLGEGGFGKVLKVERNGKVQALKVLDLKGNQAHKEVITARLLREIRVMSTIEHPGVMSIEGTTLDDGSPAYYMPIAEKSFSDIIKSNVSGVKEVDAIDLMLPVLEALHFIHQNEIIHRDLTPGNILILNQRPVISDFGLTRDMTSDSATLTKVWWGSHGYMSPEQLENTHAAAPSMDIFAAGVVLHELLCGKKPISGNVCPSLQGALRTIVHKAISRNPNHRHATAEAFGDALRDHLLGDEDLQSTSDRIRAQVESESEHWYLWEEQVRATIAANLDDADLVLFELHRIESEVWEHWASKAPEFIDDLVHALGNHMKELKSVDSFGVVDQPARLVRILWNVLSEDAQRVSLMGPLAELGMEFHRYFVAETFARVVGPVIGTSIYSRETLRILERTYGFADFVKNYFEDYKLPPAIKNKMR